MRIHETGSTDTRSPGERFFGYEMTDPWLWVPGLWVKTGTVFMTGDDRFWRLARKEHNGWWCEPVPAAQVGTDAAIRRIRDLLLQYRIAVEDVTRAQHLADQAPEPDVQAALVEKRAAAEYVRDEIVRLCNPERAPDYVNRPMIPERNWKPLLISLCVAFPLVLATGIGTLLSLEHGPREEGLLMLNTALSTLAAMSILLIVIPIWIQRNPAQARALARRLLPSGNVIGCAVLMLFTIGMLIFLFLFALAMWGPLLLRLARGG